MKYGQIRVNFRTIILAMIRMVILTIIMDEIPRLTVQKRTKTKAAASCRSPCCIKKGAVALNSAAVLFSCTFFEAALMRFLMKPLETTAFIKK